MHRAYALAAALLLLLAGGARFVTAAQDSPGGADIPTLGTAVSFIGLEGDEVARLTVQEIVDPFEDYDPSTPPERGSHFVMLRLEVENTGSRPFPLDPSAIRLQDDEGFLYGSTFISRAVEETEADPELTFADMPPGDTVSGPIFFSVFNGVELVRVLFTPDFDRLVFLADLTLRAAATPVPEEEEEPTPEAEATEEAAAGLATDGDKCAGVEEWFTATTENVSSATALLNQVLSGSLADIPAADLEEAATQIANAVDAQSEIDVPAAAEEVNDLVLQALDDYAAAIDQAIAVEGDSDALDEADQAIQDTIDFILNDITAASNELATDCGLVD